MRSPTPSDKYQAAITAKQATARASDKRASTQGSESHGPDSVTGNPTPSQDLVPGRSSRFTKQCVEWGKGPNLCPPAHQCPLTGGHWQLLGESQPPLLPPRLTRSGDGFRTLTLGDGPQQRSHNRPACSSLGRGSMDRPGQCMRPLTQRSGGGGCSELLQPIGPVIVGIRDTILWERPQCDRMTERPPCCVRS